MSETNGQRQCSTVTNGVLPEFYGRVLLLCSNHSLLASRKASSALKAFVHTAQVEAARAPLPWVKTRMPSRSARIASNVQEYTTAC